MKLYFRTLWPRLWLVSAATASLMVGDILIGTELFWPIFWPESRPDWLSAGMLVFLWVVPVLLVLKREGIRRASLAQFVAVSLAFAVLTLTSIVAVMFQLFLLVSVYHGLLR
ncbi:hypothetical protein GCM10011521_16320 [Arenimonas soli]|uniref:Sensor histidine kinase n=1 Tax=Arenimonas soli TaxID=2269504 RepID=A0ABQ1HI21_9GAMM|nr:hypothetical protein GCM10011521_16320 [Arenimonas soli]